MSNEDLQQLKALAMEATPGPWESRHHEVIADDGSRVADVACTRGKYEREKENRDYIAAANPATILALIERIESLAAPAVANGAAEPEPTIIGGRFFYTAQQMQAASAASTQQAAPRQALTDDQLADIWINRDCMDAIRAGDIRAQFICAARAAIAASAPNALLVAALQNFMRLGHSYSFNDIQSAQESARAALASVPPIP